MTEFRDRLRELLSDHTYRKLASLEPEFDLFEAFGVTYRELSHSALLAYLLDPATPHGLGARFLQASLNKLIQSPPPEKDGQEMVSLEQVIRLRFTDVVVYREKFNIDILVELRDSKFVIAIENKLWAGEQEDQVKGYQDTVRRFYPDWHSIMVFLTPYGHESTTSAADHDVPCVSMRWADISSILDSIEHVPNAQVSVLLEQTRRHIQEDIMGENEKKRLVRELFSNSEHVETIALIDKYRPQLGDCGEALSEKIPPLIKRLFNCRAVHEDRYPQKRGLPKEFKFSFKPGGESSETGSLMLVVYHYPEYLEGYLNPGLLLTAWKGEVEENRKWYESLAKINSDLFDAEVPKYREWSEYYRILKDTDHNGRGTLVPTHTFDDMFVNQVVEEAIRILEPVANAIRGFGAMQGRQS